jgi:hypothetical protein
VRVLTIIGPPAAGKMTVGRAVCARTGFRLFHNHMSIEPLLGLFEFGSPSFNRLNRLIRREVVAEAVAVDLPGLVFTYALDLDSDGDVAHLLDLLAPATDAGVPVDVAELVAPQAVRLAREGGTDRMDHKRSKRDVDWARAHVVELEAAHRFSTEPGVPGRDWPIAAFRHVRLDNAHGSPDTTAERIVALLGLPAAPTD